jgi:TonB dependent receptor/TonB-dependent Receptor Plug Domain
VIVTGERPPREVTRRTLERREISRVPGTGGDALRSIQSLPGVARPPGLAGILIVRGSGPQDTNVFIDGALVPLVYHFGGLSSVVPTELLDKIDFYPGNFSSRYGRVMGGAVDVELRSPGTECVGDYGAPTKEEGCFRGMAQLDLIDARFLLRGPIAKDWTFAVAGRRSWVDAWLKPVLEDAGAGVTTAPVYYDYQAIVEHKPDPKTKIRAQFYGSDDKLELLISNPSAQEPAFAGSVQFGTAFYRGQVIYETELTRDWDLYSTVAVGRDKIYFGIGQVEFDIDSYPIEARSEIGWDAASGFRLNGGLDFLVVPFDVHVRAPAPPRPGEPQPGPFSSRPILETDSQDMGFRPAWYLEGEWQPTERLLVVPGFRVDFARDSGHADYSPRVNARYVLRGANADAEATGQLPRKTTLKGGVGVFAQPPTFQETDPVFGTPNLESNQSLHYSIGVEQELTDQIEVSVEGYYKDLENLVSRAPSQNGSFVYDNQGEGSVIGAETLLKYKPDERFFGWLAYTLSRSERRNRPDEPTYLFQFDQTHILTVLGSYRLGNGWELGARFRVVSGNMETPVRKYPDLAALYAADAGSYTPLQGQQFSERLPLFHQLDIRVEKNWQFKDWRLVGYLDVWNAYNYAAVEDIQYDFDFDQRTAQTGLPIVPSFGIRGEF